MQIEKALINDYLLVTKINKLKYISLKKYIEVKFLLL